MTILHKVLGQISPSITSLSTLYTVPTSTQAICSTLTICNQGVSTRFRIAVRPAGASILSKHYIIYNKDINSYDTIFLTIGITLAETDIVSVYANTSNLSFSLLGMEIV